MLTRERAFHFEDRAGLAAKLFDNQGSPCGMTNEIKPLVLVTGGTGKQGGATVAALLPANKTRIRVLTRDPKSPKAQRLAQQGVELASGDLDDPAAVQAALQGVSAAFSVQTFEGKGGPEAEERQGNAFAEAVKAAGGVHLVYSSVDGAERTSGVPHFESKWRIEQHIARLGLPATILRPVAFMENFATSGFPLAMFFGMIKATMGATRKLQLVAVSDIGWFAARALEVAGKLQGPEDRHRRRRIESRRNPRRLQTSRRQGAGGRAASRLRAAAHAAEGYVPDAALVCRGRLQGRYRRHPP